MPPLNLIQQIACKKLVQKNGQASKSLPDDLKIRLPFIVVSTDEKTIVECEMSEDRSDIFLNFTGPFQIHDDTEILKQLNLHQASREEVKKMLPDELISYLPEDYFDGRDS